MRSDLLKTLDQRLNLARDPCSCWRRWFAVVYIYQDSCVGVWQSITVEFLVNLYFPCKGCCKTLLLFSSLYHTTLITKSFGTASPHHGKPTSTFNIWGLCQHELSNCFGVSLTHNWCYRPVMNPREPMCWERRKWCNGSEWNVRFIDFWQTA